MTQVSPVKRAAWIAIGWFAGVFVYKALFHLEDSLMDRFWESLFPAFILFVLSWGLYSILARRKQ